MKIIETITFIPAFDPGMSWLRHMNLELIMSEYEKLKNSTKMLDPGGFSVDLITENGYVKGCKIEFYDESCLTAYKMLS